MTIYTTSAGVEKDVDLNLDKVKAYEDEHPEWSLLDLIDSLKRFRVTDMDLMARFLGFDSFDAFIADGFTVSDMADMVSSSKYLGFTDSPSEE